MTLGPLMSTRLTTEELVYHMEADLYSPGNILFSDRSSLKTSGGEKTVTIAGSASGRGYIEGGGDTARFDQIFGFTQLSVYMYKC